MKLENGPQEPLGFVPHDVLVEYHGVEPSVFLYVGQDADHIVDNNKMNN